MYRIIKTETKLINILFTFLIILNLVAIYFVIALLSYDEMIGYLPNGEEKNCNPHNIVLLFILTNISNLLFASISLMSRLITK